MSTTLNMFDLIFIFSAIAIVLIAFFRGFVREIFSVFNWIITIALVYFLSPFLAKFVNSYSHNTEISNIISSTIIFIIIFIGSTLLMRKVSESCQEKIPFTTNQILGVIFGVFKTFLIFGLVYGATINIYGEIYNVSAKAKQSETMPIWLYDAKTRALISPLGKVLDPLVKFSISKVEERFLGKKITKKKEKIEDIIDEVDEVEESSEKPDKKDVKKVNEKYEEKGYSKKEIEKMDRLIEIVE